MEKINLELYEKNYKNNDIFSHLKKTEKIEKNKLKEHYKQLYTNCFNNIFFQNNLRKKYLIYTIPKKNVNIKNYNYIQCLNYIQDKLRKKDFETLIDEINASIFISWHDFI